MSEQPLISRSQNRFRGSLLEDNEDEFFIDEPETFSDANGD